MFASDEGPANDVNSCMVKVQVDYKAEVPCADFAENAGKIHNKTTGNFMCSCKLNDDQPCSHLFTPVELQDLRVMHQAVNKDELDLAILAQIRAGLHDHDGKMTNRCKQKQQSERVRIRVDYSHKGLKICRDAFMFIHGIFKDRLTNLISHFWEHGVEPHVHGNTNKKSKDALTYEERVYIVRYISNFAEEHGVLLPGRVPGYSHDDLKLLLSSCTKASVYQTYITACTAANVRVVAERTFYQMWGESLPDVLPMKPSTDLCWTCQRNSAQLSSLANLPDEEKLRLI